MMWLILAWIGCAPAPSAPMPTPIATPIAAPVEAPPSAKADRPTITIVKRSQGPTVCGLDPYVSGAHDAELEALATRLKLTERRAFVSVVNSLQQGGRLPDCYLTKRQAASRGWDRGEDLWDDVPGTSIGGDTFGNREGLLPQIGRGTRYVEADLDQNGGRRGAKRLVFEDGGQHIWVTVDHYESFVPVEVP